MNFQQKTNKMLKITEKMRFYHHNQLLDYVLRHVIIPNSKKYVKILSFCLHRWVLKIGKFTAHYRMKADEELEKPESTAE